MQFGAKSMSHQSGDSHHCKAMDVDRSSERMRWNSLKVYPGRARRVKHDDILAIRPNAQSRVDPNRFGSEADVELAAWRWEYLRRRQEYVDAWPDLHKADAFSSGRFGIAFGLPHPLDPDPEILVFRDAVSRSRGTMWVEFDARKSLPDQVKALKAPFGEAQRAIGCQPKRGRPPAMFDAKLLRALDLKRDQPQMTPTELAKALNLTADQAHLADEGETLWKSALRAQRTLAPIYPDQPLAGEMRRFGLLDIPVDFRRSEVLSGALAHGGMPRDYSVRSQRACRRVLSVLDAI